MTLGEFIKQYRKEHDNMSVRAFANMVGMSPQSIINIEKGTGNNGKPMSSTMNTYKKIAEAVGMSEHDFLLLLNDEVLVNPSSRSELESILSQLSDQEIDLLLSEAKRLAHD